jgi:N-acetyl-gamma-glutamyl-phosphate reductase
VTRPSVFIDGDVGTTGLRIGSWLETRSDLIRLQIDPALRKDSGARRDLLNRADLVVFCLPDDAAREAAGWIENPATRVLDASSAHRVAAGWVFGLPELEAGQRERIATAGRVSNPGCWPTAAILCLRPLVDAGLLDAAAPVVVRGVSGYSGGGRGMIERWEDPARGLVELRHDAPYALDRVHKHIPEMTRYSGLRHSPQFIPSVGPFRCGMRVEIPLHTALLRPGTDAKLVWETLSGRYAHEAFVKVGPLVEALDGDERGFDPCVCNDTNRIELAVYAHPGGHVWLMARLDNLGKGAAGAAIQNLNLMLGLPESRGLRA